MDEPWFVRRRTATSYNIVPCRWQGWAVTAAYTAAALAITPLASDCQWVAWGVILAVESFAFGLVMWRTSVAANR